MDFSKTWSRLKGIGGLATAIVAIANPNHALSEATFGFRDWRNLRGDEARLSWEQRSSISAADQNGDGYVGWIEAVFDAKARLLEK